MKYVYIVYYMFILYKHYILYYVFISTLPILQNFSSSKPEILPPLDNNFPFSTHPTAPDNSCSIFYLYEWVWLLYVPSMSGL